MKFTSDQPDVMFTKSQNLTSFALLVQAINFVIFKPVKIKLSKNGARCRGTNVPLRRLINEATVWALFCDFRDQKSYKIRGTLTK